MIAKRYLALLTGVALATSTVVVPANAVEADQTLEITADNGAIAGDVDADLGADVDADTDATEGNNAEPTAESEAADRPAPGFTVQSDGDIPLGFDLGGDVLPGVESTWPVTVAEGAKLNYYVVDAENKTKSHDNW